jgi:hypothetical protein
VPEVKVVHEIPQIIFNINEVASLLDVSSLVHHRKVVTPARPFPSRTLPYLHHPSSKKKKLQTTLPFKVYR